MAADVVKVSRPSSEQEEVRAIGAGYHWCPKTNRKTRLDFPVGVYGFGIPADEPFEVDSFDCDDCGQHYTVWYVWRGAKIVDLGALK